MELLGKIITNILTALYEPFGFSLLLSFMTMFFYLYAYEPGEAGKGWKSALVTWYERFKERVFFRKLFLYGIRDIDDPVPNAVESKFVVESAVQCVGRMGHLEDSEWRAGADNRGHRERHYDGAVHRCAHVDIRRKDRKQLEEDTVG